MQSDRRNFILSGAAMAAAAATLAGCGTSRKAAMQGQKPEAVLSDAIAGGILAGATAAVTDRNGTLFSAAKGTVGLGSPAPMTLDTVVRIASMTKPLTSVAAMQLVEQGKLSLDAPAANVLPELAEIRVLEGWSADGTPVLRAPRTVMTLRHLLTHTSGFVYDIWNPQLSRYYRDLKVPTMGTGRKAALQVPIMFDPGTQWEYGIGTDWVGRMVEAASGLLIGEYFARNLTGPLGMGDTGYKISPAMRSRLALTHLRTAEGKLEVINFSNAQDPEFESGGAGLYSTTNDYLKFLRMVLNRGWGNGTQILRPETVALMSKNSIGSLRVRPLPQNIAMLSRDAEFFPGLPKTWSLGFMINEAAAPTGRPAGSLAWAGLSNTFMWIDTQRDIAGVFMTQVLPFVDPQTLNVYYAFEKSVYDALG